MYYVLSLLYLCNGTKRFNYRGDIIEREKNPFDFVKGDEILSITSYALMPNHFHICICVSVVNIKNISKFMFFKYLYFNSSQNKSCE